MNQSKLLQVSENLTLFNARAKYIPQADGTLKLALVQCFTQPKFRKSGTEISYELDANGNEVKFVIDYATDLGKVPKAPRVDEDPDIVEDPREPALSDIERATRRAKINAFDIILSNPDLDTFATFTYRPDESLNKSSYEDCYRLLGVWLSNRVQRSGLKYVIVPERHRSGDIHFHGILNSSALKLVRARGPSGRALTREGKPLFNLEDWKHGFTTAQIIGGGEVDREKVAKYVFKYMGKQSGQKIGGRYCLIGGELERPLFVYGDTAEELIGDRSCKYDREVNVGDELTYREYSFI